MSDATLKAIEKRERRTRGEPEPKKEQPVEEPPAPPEAEDGGEPEPKKEQPVEEPPAPPEAEDGG